MRGIDALPGVHDVEVDQHRVRFAVDGEHLDGAIRALSEHGIRSLTSQPPTLEEIMLRHYGDDVRPTANGSASADHASVEVSR